ncbi:hypothetical protein L6164_029386 [Bauhinia variegata]|uniref:Uncharacterized protein n=1 Tax=Bauhinia variegata TaxID=167791 RepID=A0ACB9L8Z2_BAUVA|nr:hypothetical protein L6164_029386 [Bauhinia variegata]
MYSLLLMKMLEKGNYQSWKKCSWGDQEDSDLKNDQSDFSQDKNNNVHPIRLPTKEGEEKLAIGTLSNPLDIEDCAGNSWKRKCRDFYQPYRYS